MNGWLAFVALVLLGSLAGALWRVWRGPGDADRMMAAQLVGTAGVGLLLTLWALGERAALDVALVLALLAALAAVGFVKAASPDGAGDPEEEAPDADTIANVATLKEPAHEP
jgi:multicomponent Na+:H+ antiporter subunit F